MPPTRHDRARSEADGPHLVRLRADEAMASRLELGPADHATLEISTRESVAPGDPIQLEIAFGPLVDEVELMGIVQSVQPTTGQGLTEAVVRIHREHAPRARYLQAVLEGQRAASARAHHRVRVDLQVRWHSGQARHASRLHDLSRGGAFVVSRTLPAVGAPVELELDGSGALRLPGVVTRVRQDPRRPGFGVCFKLSSRQTAAALTAVIRRHEAAAAR